MNGAVAGLNGIAAVSNPTANGMECRACFPVAMMVGTKPSNGRISSTAVSLGYVIERE
jgi:hypothetical protein